jgi:hypothetical protein
MELLLVIRVPWGSWDAFQIFTLIYTSIDFGKLWQLRKENTHFSNVNKNVFTMFSNGVNVLFNKQFQDFFKMEY